MFGLIYKKLLTKNVAYITSILSSIGQCSRATHMKCLPYKNKISFNEVKFMFIGRLSTGTNFEHT